jgi:hypothetical protein
LTDMSLESQDLAAVLEQLALKVVVLEEDDIQGLGAFLAQLEELQTQVAQVQELVPLFQHLNEVGRRLVMQEVETASRALELLGQGVTLLQRWAREQEWPPEGEAWENYCLLAQELGLEETAPSSTPTEESSAAAIWDDPELVTNFLSEAGPIRSEHPGVGGNHQV